MDNLSINSIEVKDRNGKTSFGVEISDDEFEETITNWKEMPKTDKEILKKLVDEFCPGGSSYCIDNNISFMLTKQKHMGENEYADNGFDIAVFINGNRHEWNDIQDIF